MEVRVNDYQPPNQTNATNATNVTNTTKQEKYSSHSSDSSQSVFVVVVDSMPDSTVRTCFGSAVASHTPGYSQERMVAEVLVSFTAPTRARNGDLYWGRAMGRLAPNGMWEGWVEFARAGDDETVNTGRETGQPTHADLRYWALGLTQTFLEGALNRALTPVPQLAPPQTRVMVNSAPRSAPPRPTGLPRRIVLDPFQTFVQGEDLLRGQLMALSNDDLQNIVEAYGFPTTNAPVAPHQSKVVEQIVRGVRSRYESLTGAATPVERAEQAAEIRPDAT